MESLTDVALPIPETGKRRIFGIGGRAAAYGGILALCLHSGWFKGGSGPLNAGTAPDFTLNGFDGRSVTLSQLRGQVVVINFWASWCPPFCEEAAHLEQTWRKYRDRGVVFIGGLDTEKEALAYTKEFDITYLNGPDIGTRIADQYRSRGVPGTFFVDQGGELQGVKIGPLKAPELDERVDNLLAPPSAKPLEVHFLRPGTSGAIPTRLSAAEPVGSVHRAVSTAASHRHGTGKAAPRTQVYGLRFLPVCSPIGRQLPHRIRYSVQTLI